MSLNQYWTAYRQRHTALLSMLASAEATGTYREPWTAHPQVWDSFDDEEQVLTELHQHWHNALTGAVSVAIEDGEGALRSDVLHAFYRTVHSHRAMRKVLEAHHDHHALARLMRREHAMLASLAGVRPESLVLPAADAVVLPEQRRRSWVSRMIFTEPEVELQVETA